MTRIGLFAQRAMILVGASDGVVIIFNDNFERRGEIIARFNNGEERRRHPIEMTLSKLRLHDGAGMEFRTLARARRLISSFTPSLARWRVVAGVKAISSARRIALRASNVAWHASTGGAEMDGVDRAHGKMRLAAALKLACRRARRRQRQGRPRPSASGAMLDSSAYQSDRRATA